MLFTEIYFTSSDINLGTVYSQNDTHCFSRHEVQITRVLVILVVPGHLLFLYAIHLVHGPHTVMTPNFIVCYLSAALLQVRPTIKNIDPVLHQSDAAACLCNVSIYSYHCPSGDFASMWLV